MPENTFLQRTSRVLRALWNSDGRQIIYYLDRIGLNAEFGYPTTRALRFIRHPTAYFRRVEARATIERNPFFDDTVDRRTGYGIIPAGQLPGTDEIIALVKRLRDERAQSQTLPGEKFRETILGPADLDTHAVLREFVTSSPLLQIASDYMGAVPVLAATLGWWSVDNDCLESSQMFHIDSNDRHEIKFFINIEDVSPDDGPFTFLPADTTEHVLRHIRNPRRRISDAEVFAHCDPDDMIEATGPSGTCFAVDGCRCMHFGARTRGGSRLLLLVGFYSYFSPMAPAMPINPSPDWFPSDILRRLALGLD